MKTLILSIIQIYYRIIQVLLPNHAAKLAVKFFFSPQRTSRKQYKIFDSAKIEKVKFNSKYKLKENGSYYTKYTWGEGPTILLVHGWAGKATHYTSFIEALVSDGYRVITFDAPAHGRSDGKRTNLAEFAQIINEIGEAEQRLEAIIGHSLGGNASSLAIVQGLKVNKAFVIASPLNMKSIFDEFAESIPINKKTRTYLINFVENMTGLDLDYFSFDKIIFKHDTPIYAYYDDSDPQAKAEDIKKLNDESHRMKLHITKGLGHQKILFDSDVIQSIVREIKEEKAVLSH